MTAPEEHSSSFIPSVRTSLQLMCSSCIPRDHWLFHIVRRITPANMATGNAPETGLNSKPTTSTPYDAAAVFGASVQLPNVDKQPDQVAGGRYVAPRKIGMQRKKISKYSNIDLFPVLISKGISLFEFIRFWFLLDNSRDLRIYWIEVKTSIGSWF